MCLLQFKYNLFGLFRWTIQQSQNNNCQDIFLKQAHSSRMRRVPHGKCVQNMFWFKTLFFENAQNHHQSIWKDGAL